RLPEKECQKLQIALGKDIVPLLVGKVEHSDDLLTLPERHTDERFGPVPRPVGRGNPAVRLDVVDHYRRSGGSDLSGYPLADLDVQAFRYLLIQSERSDYLQSVP